MATTETPIKPITGTALVPVGQRRDMSGRPGNGRPSIYTKELVEEICMRLMLGESLEEICKDPGMPAIRTVMYWLYGGDGQEAKTDFLQSYRVARAVQQEFTIGKADKLAQETYDRARQGDATKEEIGAIRELLKHYQWRAARLAPKVFGDQVHVSGTIKHEHTVDLGTAIMKAREHEKRLAQSDESEIIDMTPE